MFVINGKMDSQQFAVSGVATQLPNPVNTFEMKQPDRVILQTPTNNTASIWIKNNVDVDANGSTGGYELPIASIIELPIKDYKTFYVIAGSGTQNLQVVFLGGV